MIASKQQGPQHSPADLEEFRGYLYVIAEASLSKQLRRRYDALDIVQDVYMRACIAVERGSYCREPGDSDKVKCWLRSILKKHIINLWKRETRHCRDVTREQSVHNVVDQSAAALEGLMADSPQNRLRRDSERLDREEKLAEGLRQLEPPERTAVVQVYINGMTLAELAHSMDSTETDASSYLRKVVKKLRNILERDFPNELASNIPEH